MIRLYNRTESSTGFTIVELMMAMLFVSMLLIAIAMVVIRISGIYNKGVTMQSVNQAGQAIVGDMKRVVGESAPFNVGQMFKIQRNADNESTGGRLCTGAYSYVWNIGTKVEVNGNEIIQTNKYKNDTTNTKPIRFIRLSDNGGRLCSDDSLGASIDTATTPATEMLSEADLAVQSFDIEQLTTNTATGAALYKVKMLISNADREAINTSNECKTPSEDATYQNYCAVNEFEFTVRAGGGK